MTKHSEEIATSLVALAMTEQGALLAMTEYSINRAMTPSVVLLKKS